MLIFIVIFFFLTRQWHRLNFDFIIGMESAVKKYFCLFKLYFNLLIFLHKKYVSVERKNIKTLYIYTKFVRIRKSRAFLRSVSLREKLGILKFLLKVFFLLFSL